MPSEAPDCALTVGGRPITSFLASVLGSGLEDWPGETWLDVRQIDTLAPIMRSRLDLCKSEGFDAVEADHVDGYSNSSGFPLSAEVSCATTASSRPRRMPAGSRSVSKRRRPSHAAAVGLRLRDQRAVLRAAARRRTVRLHGYAEAHEPRRLTPAVLVRAMPSR
jgi:hypothetical protein